MPRGENLKGVGGPGRPKGLQNKVTKEIKTMVEEALAQAGGTQYLVKQAKESPGAFLSLIGKLIPRDFNLTGNIGSDLVKRMEAARQRVLNMKEGTSMLPQSENQEMPRAVQALPTSSENGEAL